MLRPDIAAYAAEYATLFQILIGLAIAMFKQNTVIVVGAGASCELGLPSGEGLKQSILELLATDNTKSLGFANQRLVRELEAGLQGMSNSLYWDECQLMVGAAQRIKAGLPLALSIDNFLHTHQADERVVSLGKTLIAMSILSAEAGSKLFRPGVDVVQLTRSGGNGPKAPVLTAGLSDTWYVPLVQVLFAQTSKERAAQAFSNVTFIVFNYDRLLEQFLWMALQAYYGFSGEEAAATLAQVRFVHPYGVLGPLPWQASDAGQSVPLGGGQGLSFSAVGKRLRTFTESVAGDTGEIVKRAMSEAATILFLGFGFLDQNVTLLRPDSKSARRVIASALGISTWDQEVLHNTLLSLGREQFPEVKIIPTTCRELFDACRLQLSLA